MYTLSARSVGTNNSMMENGEKSLKVNLQSIQTREPK